MAHSDDVTGTGAAVRGSDRYRGASFVRKAAVGAAVCLFALGTASPLPGSPVPARSAGQTAYLPEPSADIRTTKFFGDQRSYLRVVGTAASGSRSAPAAAAEPAAPAALLETLSGRLALIVSSAYAGLGHDYVWGGTSPTLGWDCSGFVQWAYRRAGIELPRTEQWEALRHTGTPSPGDLVVQNPDGPGHWSHVGIYVGDGMMISALNPSVGTVLLPTWATGTSDYYTLGLPDSVVQVDVPTPAPTPELPAFLTPATAPPAPPTQNPPTRATAPASAPIAAAKVPSAAPTNASTPTATPTTSPTASTTSSPAPSPTATPTPTNPPTPSPTATPTPTPTQSASPTPTPTPSPTQSASPTPTATPVPTSTGTSLPTSTPTPTPTPSPTVTPTPTPTSSPTATTTAPAPDAGAAALLPVLAGAQGPADVVPSAGARAAARSGVELSSTRLVGRNGAVTYYAGLDDGGDVCLIAVDTKTAAAIVRCAGLQDFRSAGLRMADPSGAWSAWLVPTPSPLTTSQAAGWNAQSANFLLRIHTGTPTSGK